MKKYKRSLAELKEKAILHWPNEILQAAGDMSVLPLLIKTQDEFIALLKIANKDPLSWREVLGHSSSLTGPVFLKHLMVLSDLGGEALNKLPPLSKYCPNGVLSFDWGGQSYEYKFREISAKCSLANSSLKVDSKRLLGGGGLTAKMVDVAMLIIYGSLGTKDTLPPEVKEKCIIGGLIGRPEQLDLFVKENYIRVSRQVGGATANAVGKLAQDYVATSLKSFLPKGWKVAQDSSLSDVRHNDSGNGTNFDVVAISPTKKQFGIEVSFQVTTNSTIERKARESESLMNTVHAAGHKICYVIDGAGNINIRENAVSIICNHSDCTVSMSNEEMQHLANYLVDTEEGR